VKKDGTYTLVHTHNPDAHTPLHIKAHTRKKRHTNAHTHAPASTNINTHTHTYTYTLVAKLAQIEPVAKSMRIEGMESGPERPVT
jgi:hypothetical protein